MIKINELTIKYHRNNVNAVDNVRLRIQDGSILALVGESGCGKTTLGLGVTSLIDRRDGAITHGSVLMDGVNILRLPEKRLRGIRGKDISYIFQEPASAFNPVFTIGQQIEETLLAHGIASKKDVRKPVFQSLEQARLADPERVYRSYPHQLSGGMKQRAMIAMAICTSPRLLIADEPTTALDVDTEKQIIDLLKSLRKELSVSVLFITHNIRIVKEIADEIAVMRNGSIVESGETAKVLRVPRHEYTKLLVFSLPENVMHAY
jgi:ABC-type dipeptide/oligopeptide/nickel transport system ATPase component